jgi:FKBP-type peptidyl-prolyl cis-trans isomerase
MRLRHCWATTTAVIAVAAAGCGSDSGSSSTHASTSTTTAGSPAVVHYDNTLARPKNPGPHPGAKVDQLVIRDVRVGTGPTIQSGDRGQFDFIATNWTTGRPLDGSWRRKRAFETQIEHGVVIDGWWQGIPGMRVGGERRILVPPALGFTQSLVPGLRGATTYFDVVLLQIEPQRPRGLAGGEGGQAAAPTSR